MKLAAKLYHLEGGRRSERVAMEVDATLRDQSKTPIDVVVLDISSTGFRVSSPNRLEEGSRISLGLAGIGMNQATVIWRSKNVYGCQFEAPLPQEDVARARSGTSVIAGDFQVLPSSKGRQTSDSFKKYPPIARTAIIIGSSAMLWTMIGAATRAAVG